MRIPDMRIPKYLLHYSKAEIASVCLIVLYLIGVHFLTHGGTYRHRVKGGQVILRPMLKPGQLIAEDCVSQMKEPQDPDKYLQMNGTRVKIFYGIWLNGFNRTHEIVEPQLREIYNSGLFTRPNTTLYLIVSTNLTTEAEWIQKIDFLAKIPNKVFLWNYYNYYEYPGIRLMWEEACADPDAIYAYFHNKGTRFMNGRLGHETSLTRRVIVSWRSILSIFGNGRQIEHVGVGGVGWQWINFFWIRGSALNIRPKPIKTLNRYYYETWIARTTNKTECSQATGFTKLLLEPYVEDDPFPVDGRPGYSILYCREVPVDAVQLWRTIYHDDLIETFQIVDKPTKGP